MTVDETIFSPYCSYAFVAVGLLEGYEVLAEPVNVVSLRRVRVKLPMHSFARRRQLKAVRR